MLYQNFSCYYLFTLLMWSNIFNFKGIHGWYFWRCPWPGWSLVSLWLTTSGSASVWSPSCSAARGRQRAGLKTSGWVWLLYICEYCECLTAQNKIGVSQNWCAADWTSLVPSQVFVHRDRSFPSDAQLHLCISSVRPESQTVNFIINCTPPHTHLAVDIFQVGGV